MGLRYIQTLTIESQYSNNVAVAAESVGLHGFHAVINTAAIVFLFASANSDAYIASRSVYALSLLKQAPNVLRKMNGKGVPITALSLSAIFAFAAVVDLGITAGKGTATTMNIRSITSHSFQFSQRSVFSTPHP